MTTKTTTTKGICPGCTKPQRISKSGTIVSHKEYPGAYSRRCHGSWHEPLEIVEIEVKAKKTKPRDWCGACLKDVAIDTGDMSHNHGYKRPGWGYNVGGCPGRGHQVLAVSSSAILAERDSSADAAARWRDEHAERMQVTQDEWTKRREAAQAKARAEGRRPGYISYMVSDWQADAERNARYALEAAYLAEARLSAWEKGTDYKAQMVAYEAARAYHRELQAAAHAASRAGRYSR
jgi:hypothetical protein